jgi:hypothetical protein
MVQKIGLVSKDIVMTGGGGVTDHGALTGLLDDDHTQYLKYSLYSAKGDLLIGTGASTASKLTVGANWKVPTAASGEATGLKYFYPTDSGATFPASPYTGMLFTHAVTGRTILYEYSGAAWIPLYSIGAMTLYVDNTDGTDTLETKGTGVDAAAFKTVQFAIDCIPPVFTGNVIININSESYAEDVIIRGKKAGGNYSITLKGIVILDANYTASGAGQQGATTTLPTFVCAAATFTASAKKNLLFKFTSGANNNLWRIIYDNTTTTLTLAGDQLTAAPALNDTGSTYNWGTTIQTLLIDGVQNVNINDIKATKANANAFYAMNYASVTYTRCWSTTTSTGYSNFLGIGYARTLYYQCLSTIPSGATDGQGFDSQCSYLLMVGCKASGYGKNYTYALRITGLAYGQFGGGNILCDSLAGVYVIQLAVALCVINGVLYNFIRDNGIGINAVYNGVASYTAYNSYSGNTANETPSGKTDPSYID